MMNMALPRLVVAASNLQTGLRELVPATTPVYADVSEEELQAMEKHEKHEAEARGEEELNRLGISLDEVYSVVPHMEQMIYQASCLVNSARTAPAPVVMSKEPPFGAGEPVQAM